MKKLIAIAVIAAAAFLTSSVDKARAQGIHIGGRGVHIDIGRVHSGHYGRYGSFYRGSSHDGGHSSWGGYRSPSRWHDTSHYDFHPGGYERHYNHYHYVPSQYNFHREGHWDHH